MAIQTINLGTYANDGTGDDLRTAFQKVNANLIELYSISGGANIGVVPPISGVEEGELWWSTVEGRLYIKYGTSWVDASPVDGNVTYDLSAETTTGGAALRLNGTDLSVDNIKIASGANIAVTRTDANTITVAVPDNDTIITGSVRARYNSFFGPSGFEFIADDTELTNRNQTPSSGTRIKSILGYVDDNDEVGFIDGMELRSLGRIDINAGLVQINTDGGNRQGAISIFSSDIYLGSMSNNPIVLDGGVEVRNGNVTGNVTGNAETVTNGVYTTSSVNALADVDTATATPTVGQALVWNGTNWIPGTVATSGASNNFDFGNFAKQFTDPVLYLLDKVGMDMGSFTLPAEQSVDLGLF